METILKFDRVILIKEMNEKFRKVGEVYEIAVVREDSFLLRDGTTRVAVGVVTFDDFENFFVKEEEFKGYTPWTPLAGVDGQTDVFYRTNRKRVQVRFLKDCVRAEASCHESNEFNLFFGLQIAYMRACNKALLKREEKLNKELKEIYEDVAYNNRIVEKMIGSLGA